MKITDLPAYRRINEKFENGEFHKGTKSALRIYSYENGERGNLTPGHYVDAISYGRIRFCDIPQECRTRDFFVNALSSVHKDVLAYVKGHIGEEFDRDFFKDHIATERYALEFEENCFEYMPLDYINEEMVSCAMLVAVEKRYVGRRGDFDDWFYSVAKRKPEILTQDFWTLGARLFAVRKNGVNKFLEITPEKYRTEEYYFAMCLENDTPVMEDFPVEILNSKFLFAILYCGVSNIKSFSEEALEQRLPMSGKSGEVKFWQVAILMDGWLIKDIALNEERVAFFLEHYGEDSREYQYGFKDNYERYLKSKSDAPGVWLFCNISLYVAENICSI